MNVLDRILLWKASKAADAVVDLETSVGGLETSVGNLEDTVEEQISIVEDIVITDTGVTAIPIKKKNVKANATAGDIEVQLPLVDVDLYDTVNVIKTDDSANTVTVSNLSGDDKVLVYQYQSVVASWDGAAWQLIEQVLPPTEANPDIHKGTSPPTDLTRLWYDTN